MVQHSLPFQDVTVAAFRGFWYFLYLLTIADSEIGDKNHEEDLIKETRRDRPIFNKMVGNYDKCEFFNFFLFKQAKMIISVLVTWMIVDCNLAVRVLLSFYLWVIDQFKNDRFLALLPTLSLGQVK